MIQLCSCDAARRACEAKQHWLAHTLLFRRGSSCIRVGRRCHSRAELVLIARSFLTANGVGSPPSAPTGRVS